MESYSWRLGLESLKQHARRNSIAGCAIAVGLLAMLSVIGYVTRSNSYLAAASMYVQQPGHLAIVKKNGLRLRLVEPKRYSLSPHEQAALKSFLTNEPNVDFSSPYLFASGLIGNGCKSFAFNARGFEPRHEQAVRNHAELKTVIPEYKALNRGEDLWATKLEAPLVLSGGLAKKLGKSASAPAGAATSILKSEDCDRPESAGKMALDRNVQLITQDNDNRLNAVDGNLSGEFSTGIELTENNSLQMPLSLMQSLLRTDRISYLGVFLKDRTRVDELIPRIVKNMADQGIEIEAYSWNDERWNPGYFASSGVMVVTEIFVGIVVAFVVLLSIMNTLTIGLAEARREIGMLRAVGFKPSQISSIFAVESFLTALIAVILGSLFCVGIFSAISMAHIALMYPGFSQASTFQITPPAWSYIASSLFLCVLVVGTSLTLARRYASQPILELLDRGG